MVLIERHTQGACFNPEPVSMTSRLNMAEPEAWCFAQAARRTAQNLRRHRRHQGSGRILSVVVDAVELQLACAGVAHMPQERQRQSAQLCRGAEQLQFTVTLSGLSAYISGRPGGMAAGTAFAHPRAADARARPIFIQPNLTSKTLHECVNDSHSSTSRAWSLSRRRSPSRTCAIRHSACARALDSVQSGRRCCTTVSEPYSTVLATRGN